MRAADSALHNGRDLPALKRWPRTMRLVIGLVIVARLGSLAWLSGAAALPQNAPDRCSFAAAIHAFVLIRDGASIIAL